MRTQRFIVLLLLVLLIQIAWGQIPRIINYQGKITDDSGVALHSIYLIEFKLFNAATGGVSLWSETHSVEIVNGLFDIQLGTTIPINLDFSEPYWIELSISSDGGSSWETFEPREKLASVSYAFRALNADNSAYVENALQSVSSSENRTGRIGHMMFIPTESSAITESVSEDTIYIAISGSGVGTPGTLEELTNIQIPSSDQGDILYFNGENWVDLNPGTAGQLLTTGGVGANPSWSDISIALNDLSDVSGDASTAGDILYYDGAQWAKLPPGTAGLFLKSNGAGSPPEWATGAGADSDWIIDGDLVYNDTKNVKVGTSPIDVSALFEVESTEKGVLIPRTTPASITSPATGLVIYNTDCDAFNYFDGTKWILIPDLISGSISGTSSICRPADGFIYAIPEVAGATYSWTVPTGVVIDGASDGHFIRLNFGASATSGEICVTATGPCGSNTKCIYVTISASPSIISHPSNADPCEGNDATFTVTATGDYLTYQWQQNTGSGFSDMGGETGSSVTLIGVTTGMDGYQYRCVITGDCSPQVTSNSATLTVKTSPSITSHPEDYEAAAGNNAYFDVTATGDGLTYQWQQNTGGGFSDMVGENSANLTVPSVTAGMDGYQYRCIVGGDCPPSVTSNSATLTIATGLFAFSSHTFTECGAWGRFGPTLSQCRAAYSTTWDEDDAFFNMTVQGIQEWTIPKTGSYRLTVAGAEGGDYEGDYGGGYWSGNIAGKGAIIEGTFTFTEGDVIKILVGQEGDTNSVSTNPSIHGGGGGGTFVFINATDGTPLVAAGGGSGDAENNQDGCDASTTDIPNSCDSDAGYIGIAQGGNGGIGAGGAGWTGNGQNGTAGNSGTGGLAPRNGGTGGEGVYNGYSGNTANGGFGGGGAGGSQNGASGGGGGYTGGGGGLGWTGSTWGVGAGGASYINPSATSVSTSVGNTGHGYVTIELLD